MGHLFSSGRLRAALIERQLILVILTSYSAPSTPI
jgi:hypothetical protein